MMLFTREKHVHSLICASTKAAVHSFVWLELIITWASSSKQEIRKTLSHCRTQRRPITYRVVVKGGTSWGSRICYGALRLEMADKSFFSFSLTVGTSLYCGPSIHPSTTIRQRAWHKRMKHTEQHKFWTKQAFSVNSHLRLKNKGF